MTSTNNTAPNPFEHDLGGIRKAGPFTFVVFGASGDLTRRKLIPALYNLFLDGFVSKPFNIVGYARREKPDQQFRDEMRSGIEEFSRRKPRSAEHLEEFLTNLTYVQGDFEEEQGYTRLHDHLKTLAATQAMPTNHLYYLSTPPSAFQPIIRSLDQVGLVTSADDDDNWTRVVVEKPFGRDRTSAWTLNGCLHKVFSERQVYRIDHYLGKETVQNLLVFRLGNSIFEPLWNRRYVDNVQVTAAESIGIGSRAGYFDSAGIIRDMVQSHLMQVFALITMEPPASFDTDAIRDEKAKVLRALRECEADKIASQVVRGQYQAGSVGGEKVIGYLEEKDVPSESQTETYAAIKLQLDNWRWSGVPFYLRTGKRLPKRVTEVDITFKEPPHLIFARSGCESLTPNVLRLRIQQHEGISLSLGAKVPGQSFEIKPVRMDFMYSSSFGQAAPEAYERLILDAINGDSTLFSREDEVDLSWKMVDQITSNLDRLPVHPYIAGDYGPEAADEMLKNGGHSWYRL